MQHALFTALLCNGSLLLPASAPLLEMGEKPRGLTNLVLTAPLFPPVFRTLEAPFWRLEGGWSAAETVTPLGLEAVRRILSNTSSVSISVSVLQLGEGGWELLSIRGACVGVACDE